MQRNKKSFYMYIKGITLLGLALFMFKIMKNEKMSSTVPEYGLPFFYLSLILLILFGAALIWHSSIESINSIQHTMSSSSKEWYRNIVFILFIAASFFISNFHVGQEHIQKRGYILDGTQKIEQHELDSFVIENFYDTFNDPEEQHEHTE